MAHPDLDALLNELLPFAERMLQEHDEFYPFAAMTQVDGDIVHVGGDTGTERPTSTEVIDVLVDGLRGYAGRGEIRAAAICLDMRIVPPGHATKTDAICTRLEHVLGEAVDAYLPYRKLADHYEYDDLFATAGERRIFMPRRDTFR